MSTPCCLNFIFQDNQLVHTMSMKMAQGQIGQGKHVSLQSTNGPMKLFVLIILII
jgi:hypothetical protein